MVCLSYMPVAKAETISTCIQLDTCHAMCSSLYPHAHLQVAQIPKCPWCNPFTTMPPSKLFVLPLPHPLILLPAAHIAILLSRSIGKHILFLSERSDYNSQPVLAAIPITNPSGPQTESNGLVFSECTTAERAIRLLKSPQNPTQPYLLSQQGITWVHLKTPPKLSVTTDSLIEHPIEYPRIGSDAVPLRESVEVFKSVALRLPDWLVKNVLRNTHITLTSHDLNMTYITSHIHYTFLSHSHPNWGKIPHLIRIYLITYSI